MGLLDGILGNVLGGAMGGGGLRNNNQPSDNPLGSILGGLANSGIAKGALLALAFQLLQRNGGISGILDKLRGSGLGHQGNSWISTGANLPISPDQINDALGAEDIGQLANQYGMTPGQASGGLAELLPELVNQMTPTGQIPADDHSMISDALAALAPRNQS